MFCLPSALPRTTTCVPILDRSFLGLGSCQKNLAPGTAKAVNIGSRRQLCQRTKIGEIIPPGEITQLASKIIAAMRAKNKGNGPRLRCEHEGTGCRRFYSG